MEEAKRRIFGFVLMNDWSARDIQKWEYVPLGPFTAKNFATSISPWIVPTEALEAFRVPTSAVTQETPTPLEYLQDPDYSSYDVQLSVAIQSPTMKEPHVVCRTNFANLYWNAAQQLVHHSVTGCIMNPGDLLASGTISGQSPDSFGSMLELSWKGSRLVDLGGGETRKFLQDGDRVTMKGFCSKEGGHGRVGFGECTGQVLPAGSTMPTPVAPPCRYQNFKLYSYWRSSSSWRVRIALVAKGIPFEVVPVNLKRGEHKSDNFLAKNPLGQVPVLEYTDTETGSVHYMTQSVTMMEFLDQCFPHTKSLIPADPMDKIAASEMVQVINAGIQPLQNAPMVMNLERVSEGKIVANDFARDVIVKGLKTMEILIQRRKVGNNFGPFCMGNFSPTIVDAFLIPQLHNARRFGVDVNKDFPILAAIDQKCLTHPWFVPAHANVQIGAEE
jgi:fumarylacetoacetase